MGKQDRQMILDVIIDTKKSCCGRGACDDGGI